VTRAAGRSVGLSSRHIDLNLVRARKSRGTKARMERDLATGWLSDWSALIALEPDRPPTRLPL